MIRLSQPGLIAAGAAIAAAAGAIGYGLALFLTPSTSEPTAPGSGEREILYWYDPMVPTQRFDRPGKSPFMDMDLVPRYAGEAEPGAGVRIAPNLAQNLGVRLAVARRGTLTPSIEVAGVIDFNERDVAIVQARSGGFVERSYGHAPGDVIGRGAPLVDLYVPEWAGAQTEFLALLRTGEPELIAAGRQRLELRGMPRDLIASIERSGRERPVVTVTTPIGGVIETLNVRPGMTVAQGMTLAEINGLATVWLNASVPEAQGGLIRPGQTVSAALAAFPGETFAGRVSAVLPAAETESRTLKVRIELPNGDGRLRPGMFATVRLSFEPERTVLLVPADAVIRTGRRNLVMVSLGNGRYQPAEVRIGREAEGEIEILAGLNEGEQVVASGQFLIDSEASLAGVVVRPLDSRAPAVASAAAEAARHETRGRIEALSPETVTLSHEPVPAIGWPAMTMNFRLASPELAAGLQVGDEVAFAFEEDVLGYVVRRIVKSGSAR